MPPRKQTGRRGRPRKNAPPAEEIGFMQWMNKASGAEAHKFMTEKHSKARPPRVAHNEYDYEDYVESLKPPPPSQAFNDYMNSYLNGATDPSLLDEPMEEETEVAGFDINEYLNLPESPKEATQSTPTAPPCESDDDLNRSGAEVSDQRAGPSEVQEVAVSAPSERATAQVTQASGATDSPSVAGDAMDVDAPAHPASTCTQHPAPAPQAVPNARPISSLSRPRNTRPTSPNLSYYREDSLPPVLVDPTSASSPAHYRPARAAYSPMTGLSGYETGTSSYGQTMHRSLSSIYDQPLASTSYQLTGTAPHQPDSSCLPPPGTYRLSNNSVEAVNSIPSPPSSQTSSTSSPLSHAATPPSSTFAPPSSTSVSSIPTYAPPAPSAAPPKPLQPSHSLGPPSHSLLQPSNSLLQPSHSLGPLSFARSDDTFMQAVANGTPHLVPDPKPRYVPCLWKHCTDCACATPCECLARPTSRERLARPTSRERPARPVPCTDRACPTPCARDVCPTPCARHACPKWFDRALPREALLVDIYAHFMFFGYSQEQLDAIVMRVYAEVVGA
ncbi:hypothetical protein K525DRAFT_245162 [Schizophyllum commune Loenen D]|nr:hypothetical protein K525DRAFT_245162 [Schizophyllum commune Loenen D]